MGIAEILEQVKALSYDERKELMKQMLDTLESPPVKSRHLSELRGLGKEIWEGIDAQEYVDQMRDEWDENR